MKMMMSQAATMNNFSYIEIHNAGFQCDPISGGFIIMISVITTLFFSCWFKMKSGYCQD